MGARTGCCCKSVNVRAYGARGDAQSVADGEISAGSERLGSASAPFVPGDDGKSVSVARAGAGGGTLVGAIAAYVSPREVQLTSAAATTVTDGMINWGTDDTASIQAAIDAAKGLPTATVCFPPGVTV